MKKCRVELSVILEIDVDDEKDDDKAMKIAERIAMNTLTGNCRHYCDNIFDDDGIYMANAACRAIDCEDVDYTQDNGFYEECEEE